MNKANKTTLVTKILIIAFLVIILTSLAGDPFPVLATTPVSLCPNGASLADCEKPEGLKLTLPYANGKSVALGSYNYGTKDHQNQDYYALDFMFGQGDVRAVAGGTVVWSGWYQPSGTNTWKCYGNSIAIKHDTAGFSNYISLYTHLSSRNVSSGNQVSQGDAIGLVGDTGMSLTGCGGSGSHLHFVLMKGDGNTLTGNGDHPPSGGIPVVPEPFIGQEVYEGFGAPMYWKGPMTAADLGVDSPSGPPSGVKWSASTIANNSVVRLDSSGTSTIKFAIEGLPSDTKEVRFTAWYDGQTNEGWSTKGGDSFSQNWRILDRCWPGKIECLWGLGQTTLVYTWKPYNDVDLASDAPWLPSGKDFVYKAYKEDGYTQTRVCISFDVFDKAGNVAYAPAGIQCSSMAPGDEFDKETSSSVAADSARMIYINPVSSQTNDSIAPTGSWSFPTNGQTISSSSVTLSVNASDNAGGSGVREVHWRAKYNGQWYGVGTDYDSPYSINWDWCKAGAQNGDVELEFEVWDNANNKFANSIHVNKSYNCDNGGSGSINWSTHFYNGMDHWWDPNNTNNQMCSGSFSQGNLDQNYRNGSPCGGGASDNWVGDYRASVNFLPGYYSFWVDHDDWLKLRVDGREIYSVNGVHSEWKCVDNGYMYLSGYHDIWAILAEQGGDARIKVEWSKNNGVCDLPAAFSKASPLNGLGDQSLTPTLSWGSAGGADSYSYCMNTTNDNSCAIGGNVGIATSVTLSALNPGTTYYWQVKAYSKGGAGTWADGNTWWSFTTSPNPPGAFNKVGPVTGSNLQPTSLALQWEPSNGAYWYQYCYDATNDSICDGDLWYSAGSDTIAQINNLAYNTIYYWQVRAINGGGITNSSGDFWSFQTKAEPLIFYSSATNDGWVAEYFESSNFGGTMNSTATTLRIGDNAVRKEYRSILSFETGASIPDNAVITKVTLKLMQQAVVGGGNPVVELQGFMLDMRRGTFGTSPLKIADWQASANKTFGPYTPKLTGGWYTFNLIKAKAYINKLATGSGLTQIRLRFQLDDNNNAIANYLSLYSGNAGAASRPQLIIEYYVP